MAGILPLAHSRNSDIMEVPVENTSDAQDRDDDSDREYSMDLQVEAPPNVSQAVRIDQVGL